VTAWLIRAGKSGERDTWSLDSGLSGGGFLEVEDLTPFTTREQISAAVARGFPGAKPGKINNFAGQLWALRSRVQPGDLVALPVKTTSQIALGIVTQGYEYQSDPDLSRRHVVHVDWKRIDLPRTALHQDLLYSLGAFMTICEIRKNDGEWRLRHALLHGKDPGRRTPPPKGHDGTDSNGPDDSELEPGPEAVDVERAARDRIAGFIQERFMGHGLADIVAEVLRAEGHTCLVSPPGADNSVDILAGRGPLGLDSPRVIVQVKSEAGPVGAPVVMQLSGAMANNNCEQGLLVAWGGVTKPAREELKKVRATLWDSDQLIERIFRVYARLPDVTRAELPLRQVWVLVEEGE